MQEPILDRMINTLGYLLSRLSDDPDRTLLPEAEHLYQELSVLKEKQDAIIDPDARWLERYAMFLETPDLQPDSTEAQAVAKLHSISDRIYFMSSVAHLSYEEYTNMMARARGEEEIFDKFMELLGNKCKTTSS